ncbi:hypothetical protein ACFQFC_13975 [Amorphoplanes digitatis]|uniref:Uncharacterized protein n=1 Tax=Actinoplanes digitatis TaxID=1868 RepID=A0A7W7I2M8_9ACTN|nr:hypothetical protein [Actinoplanes digitatis]MBB4765312.1 hypothetical protein [Actinoplanes digitatis]GID95041.1 hypothetical protein Adi01nite_44530 [Actinoplanes digitatis]
MMDVIVAALAAGASAGVSGSAGEAVGDGYRLLKALIWRRFTGRQDARRALDADETEPGVWRARIGPDLVDSGAAEDEQILAAARELLAAAAPDRAARFAVTVDTNEGAIGEFHDTVIFDRRTQLPPIPPAAG